MNNDNLDLHRRYNPLTDSWVLVSPHRNKRPWQGQRESATEVKLRHDPSCYLCPGNTRINKSANPDYKDTYIFENDFPALIDSNIEHTEASTNDLFKEEKVSGTCKVVCFSPQHNLSLAQMSTDQILKVIKLWKNQSIELGEKYQNVQIFENKGSVMGCSNPHPHGQIWASNHLPDLVEKENENQDKYFQKNNQNLLFEYQKKEREFQKRIVAQNENWIAVVPYWAAWPFETIVLPNRRVSRMEEINDSETQSLSILLKELLVKYDNLFQCSFPYSMGWHQAPLGEKKSEQAEHWLLHAHFYPPLLRSADVKKFMVGFEMLGETQRDLTPELAAQKLNEQSTKHYLED